jgi:hypothetical protein
LATLLASDGDCDRVARILTGILAHPHADASVRQRAVELLGGTTPDIPTAFPGDSTNEIDLQVRDILQHGWLSQPTRN